MRKPLHFLFFLLLLAAASMSFAQDETMAVHVRVTGAWARATAVESMDMGMGHEAKAEGTPEADAMGHAMTGGGVSAAYMVLENTGGEAVSLVSAATKAAGVVEIHETMMEDNVMRMRPLADRLVIPAGETVALEPGGYHVMLLDLTQELVPGDAIALTLTFDSGEQLVIGVPVLDEAPMTGAVVVTGAWARATAVESMDMGMGHEAKAEGTPEADAMGHAMTGGGVSAAYMVLENTGGEAVSLVSAATKAAGVVEIHETMMEDNVMRMRPLADGLVIPAGETVALEPGGYHVMLLDLTQELVPGDAIALTLTFDSGEQLVIGVPIKDAMMEMDHGN